MADSDDNPSSGPASTESAPSPSGGAPEPLAKVPRAHPHTIGQRRDPGEALQDDAEISLEELLAWARSFEGAEDEAAEPEPKPEQPEPGRRHLSREKRKFHKFDPEAAKAAQEAAAIRAQKGAAEVGDPETVEDEDAAEGEGTDFEGGTIVPEDPRKGLRRPKQEPRSLWSSLFLQLVILSLVAAGFFFGRATMTADAAKAIKRPPPIPANSEKAPSILPPLAMDLIDQAVVAENAGDTKKAAALLDQVRHSSGHIDGLDFQLAALAFHSGDAASAMILLNRSISDGEKVSECYALRGLIANQRGPAKGLHDFEAATQADPFEARGFFYWGEALRRSGKPQTALIHLQQAVERAQSPWDRARYQYKVRLTQIELGEEKDFQDKLVAEMALPRPAVEWVLTAAASNMHKGDYPAAAADLAQARQLLNRSLLALELHDYFFMAYAAKPVLAPVYAEVFQRAPTRPASATVVPTIDALPATLIPTAIPANGSPAP